MIITHPHKGSGHCLCMKVTRMCKHIFGHLYIKTISAFIGGKGFQRFFCLFFSCSTDNAI